jgi:transcriptional regulator with XRE-family HTH domain
MPHSYVDFTCEECKGSGRISINNVSFTCLNCDGLGIVGKYMETPEVKLPEPTEFGTWLRNSRLSGKITFTDLYSKTGILRSRISDIENGFGDPFDPTEEALLRNAINTLTTSENMMDNTEVKSMIDDLISAFEKYPGPMCDTELANWEKETTAVIKQIKDKFQQYTEPNPE